MSILRSLNIGAAGLRANGEAIAVTGDNIANINTVGFKRSRAVFQDVLGRSIATFEPVKTAGAGSRLAHVEQMWSQGSIVTTESPTDLAIQGDGFFVIQGNLAGAEARYYSRAGQFHIDNEGLLVNEDGLRLQGFSTDGRGVLGATIGDLKVSQGTVPANATANASIATNLDSNSLVPGIVPFDITNPTGSTNFSNQITVFDSLGNDHELTVYYNKTADNSWEWHAVVSGEEITGGLPGAPPFEGANGTLTFTPNGELDTETPGTSSWDFIGGPTQTQQILFDFGTSLTTDNGNGLDGSTQFASPSATVGLEQDGFSSGTIAGISIAQDGTIFGVFSNGQTRAIGQIVTADFASVNGLDRAGQGMWIETLSSGQAMIGSANAAGRGAIISGALEQANVDLGIEFVNLIAYQRAFSANSRVITTSDEMYSELVNIKR